MASWPGTQKLLKGYIGDILGIMENNTETTRVYRGLYKRRAVRLGESRGGTTIVLGIIFVHVLPYCAATIVST